MGKLRSPNKSTEFFFELEKFLEGHGWVLRTFAPHINTITQVHPTSSGAYVEHGLIEEQLTLEASGFAVAGGPLRPKDEEEKGKEEADGANRDSREPGGTGG
jgi:hypothetical protein